MFKTSDLYLASYLKALGKDLEKTERKENKVYFIFTEVSDAEVVGFYNNSLLVLLPIRMLLIT